MVWLELRQSRRSSTALRTEADVVGSSPSPSSDADIADVPESGVRLLGAWMSIGQQLAQSLSFQELAAINTMLQSAGLPIANIGLTLTTEELQQLRTFPEQ